MSFYTLPQIHDRRAKMLALGFEFPAIWSTLSDTTVQAAANGVGPDAFPSVVRRLLTGLLPYGDLPADVHDVEFQFSDGTKASFEAANNRFYHNCRQWILADRASWDPRRYIELWRARRDRDILMGDEGWKAWLSAHERYGKAGA
jgi:hypothetical protein